MNPDTLNWNDQGLIPAIVQDIYTRKVLMVAYMNRDALARTQQGEHVWFWSRSRQELWEKGATSGNYLLPKQLVPDCENNSLLVLAEATGPACHTGSETCFFQDPVPAGPEVLAELAQTIAQRNRERPEGSYTAKLLSGGIDRIAKKVGEESAEVIIAAKNGAPSEIAWEVGDLLYHTLVLLEATGVPLDAIYEELIKRRK